MSELLQGVEETVSVMKGPLMAQCNAMPLKAKQTKTALELDTAVH